MLRNEVRCSSLTHGEITCILPLRVAQIQFFRRLFMQRAWVLRDTHITQPPRIVSLSTTFTYNPLIHKMNRTIEELRASHMRFESPEPESRQGRRNERTAGVQLLDADGAISIEVCELGTCICQIADWASMETQLEACLAHIFAKYCTPRPEKTHGLLVPPEGAYLSSQGLDDWARDTNGSAFDEDSKEELLMFMDCTAEGGLT